MRKSRPPTRVPARRRDWARLAGRATAVAGIAALMGTALSALPVWAQATSTSSPTSSPVARPSEPAADYLVAVRPSANPEAVAQAAGATTDDTYDAAINGFSAELAPDEVARLQADPRVTIIEPDHPVHAIAVQSPTPSWGLDRVDQRDLPLDGSYTSSSDGAGVRVYVVDTGVLLTHAQFAGRVAAGFDALGGNANDCNGHGTHVAGTIAGATFGLAKGATIVPVRVLDCNGGGYDSGVIAGIDWAIADHTTGPAVLNMSLGGPVSSLLDAAVGRATADGITVTVAAGNSGTDACGSSPARAPSALTVGATTPTDARASYSNTGACLDLFAPGSGITSAYNGSSTATATLSGTSMASAHVAGMAAVTLGGAPSASPTNVAATMVAAATPGKVTSAGVASPNRLLYSTASAPPPPAPTVPAVPATPVATAGDTSALVRWTAPSDGGSPITGYAVTASPGGTTVPVGAPATAVVVTGLTNGTSYTFTVSATNAVGASAASLPSAPVTPTAPTPPSAGPGRRRCIAAATRRHIKAASRRVRTNSRAARTRPCR